MLIFQKQWKTGPNNHELRIQRPKISGHSIFQHLIWLETSKVNLVKNLRKTAKLTTETIIIENQDFIFPDFFKTHSL